MTVPTLPWTTRTTVLPQRASALLLAALAGLGGCGGDDNPVEKFQTYEVKGQVLLADGKPLKGGMIHFEAPDNLSRKAIGKIAPDGTFALNTGGSGPGAAPGQYKVRVEPEDPTPRAAKDRRGSRPGRPPFPVKYTDEDASGLVFTLTPAPTQLEPIRLK
jgi:hypothetical protein